MILNADSFFNIELNEPVHEDESIFFLSADFDSPRLDRIKDEFAGRFVNVGISEQGFGKPHVFDIGGREDLHGLYGIDVSGIVDKIREGLRVA